MKHGIDTDSMVCPKCGVEQARAETCGFCGIIVEKYKKSRSPTEKVGLTTGLAGAVLLLLLAGAFFAYAFRSEERAAAPPPPQPPPPDVITAKDPTVLGVDWFDNASGFRRGVETQIAVKETLVVFARTKDCAVCTDLQRDVLNSEVFRAWADPGVKVRLYVDQGPAEQELATKLGVKDTPVMVVVRTNGQREIVPMLRDGQPLSAEALTAACKKASGR